MKRILSLLLCALLVFSFAGCSGNNNPSNSSEDASSETPYTAVDMNIGAIKGPTGVGMVSLMADADNKKAANNYNFTVTGAPDEIVGKISSKELDIAAVPTNLAATLYNKTKGGVKILAVNTYSVLSVIEVGTSVSSVEDLKGKTIYSTGEGSNPEYILRYILEKNGIDPDKDVKIEFLTSNDELVTKIVSGAIKLAVVPEPAASTVLKKALTARRALLLGKEWEKVAPESALMMGCVIVRTEFLRSNPDAVAKFLEEYEKSVNAVSDVTKTAELCVKYEMIANEEIALSAIPNCGIAFCAGNDMKTRLSGYLQVLFDANPKSIGGAMPDDAFYYIG